MIIQYADFIMSNTDVRLCPKPDKPEYAFIGRSNVGKSSLINMITSRRKLAKISGTPGKTITINHFVINTSWYLVDLPGYGFAKRSKSEREKWEKMIRNYLLRRENLVCVFVLIDIRHEPQKNDLEFMEWLALSEIPFTLVFTKADKLKPMQLTNNEEAYRHKLLEEWEELPPMVVTSAEKGDGREALLDYIDSLNTLYHDQKKSGI
ncbi:MAG: YihA family ribosome biogenesis GTP-binding protein [Bacteroidetes bacterium GWF2_41_31]|nr:MAG: YihA family ribosome biogenesis GTP-binding protein [Bacteroidetes bacterium GWF2_41_31]OFZ09078.1 MAG: YihA family ribosome biogenesis GTP-binding protein [Bacteroidetes bacterium RIFOXYB12_FULL_41_6]